MSQIVLYSPFGSGLPEYEYRKQLTPLTVYIHKYIIHLGKSVLSIPIFSELSRFNGWNSAKRFFNMSAVPFGVRRYKDKNYLAKTFIMSCIFCKNTHFSPNGCRFDCIFNITPTCFYRNVWI